MTRRGCSYRCYGRKRHSGGRGRGGVATTQFHSLPPKGFLGFVPCPVPFVGAYITFGIGILWLATLNTFRVPSLALSDIRTLGCSSVFLRQRGQHPNIISRPRRCECLLKCCLRLYVTVKAVNGRKSKRQTFSACKK